MLPAHPTPKPPLLPFLCAVSVSLCLWGSVSADDDLNDFLNNSRPATAPSGIPSPSKIESPAATTAPEESPTAPPRARLATITLNNNKTLTGPTWTTRDAPFRLWIEERKTYRDLEPALVSRVTVKVLKEGLEDDWRWLKEGSDQKVFSGKKYPAVELLYTFTLLNGQSLEGGVVAPIYLLDPATHKPRQLALYKQFKGPLGSPLSDLIYIRSIDFAPATLPPTTSTATTKLPLLPDE